jgi:hypothetical protein
MMTIGSQQQKCTIILNVPNWHIDQQHCQCAPASCCCNCIVTR